MDDRMHTIAVSPAACQ